VGDFRARGRPFVYGHRGASARAPENTLRAFALAMEEGADGVELDVRLSRDGVVVVVHDPDLRRVAGRPDSVHALRASDLAGIDAGGDAIPTLDAVFDRLSGLDALVNVEMKGDVPDRLALVRAVGTLLRRRSANERDRVVVSSFRPEMLVAIRAFGPRVRRAFLFDHEHTGSIRAALLGRAIRPDGLHPQHALCSPGAIARWHRRRLFVNAWTVDDPARVRALAETGIDGLITNDPAGVVRVLAAPLGSR
jgi:glycerophosphoryl diester phosphodiesterase